VKAVFALLLAATLAGCSPRPDAPPVRPHAVLLIRHAEKPDDATDVHLSPAGRTRADALPDLFEKTAARPDPFPKPDAIFAAAASKRSNRSAETVAPLAKALKLDVHTKYDSDDYAKLAAELRSDARYDGKTVLVCWHHGTLPELATALGASGVPDKWKDAAFDRVWVVTFDAAGKGRPLARRAQALMPGDTKE
jgi:broad specificity phosphatase PhoE